MELLTVTAGQTRLALVGVQVAFIEAWADVRARKVPLAEALGLTSDGPCSRAVVFESADGPVAYGVSSSVGQVRAEPGSVLAVSRVLRRLRAPGWLAGFYLGGAELALIVDLPSLSLPSPTRNPP